MQRACFCFVFLFLMVSISLAQKKAEDLYWEAETYYKKGDYKKAFALYEEFYVDSAQTMSNYGTYYAAVSACHSGNLERAKYYLTWSGKIGYDTYEYERFANDTANVCLHDLAEWKAYMSTFKHKTDSTRKAIAEITAQLNDSTIRVNSGNLGDTAYWYAYATENSLQALMDRIKTFNDYNVPKESGFWTLYHIKANDTLDIPFLLYIPKNYLPTKKTPLYIYLHGAVANRLQFVNPAYVPDGSEIKIMEKAMAQGTFVLYPFGKKDFGWLYQQEAFETIMKALTLVKSWYNIDDNRVHIGGHSNGGSGAFWFALNKPAAFSAFFGLNYLPKVYGSNTPIRNLASTRPFYGISGLNDKTFAFSLVEGIYDFSRQHSANWVNYAFEGNHGLAMEHRDSINFLFDTLATKIRGPFPKEITWETDDVRNGRNAWLEISKLDTLAEKADWHQDLNPTITQNGKTGEVNFNKNRSGAILATVDGNVVRIQSSRVKEITLYLSPDMFNLKKKIKVFVNDKLLFAGKIKMNKSIVLQEFMKTKDRSFVVASKLSLTLN